MDITWSQLEHSFHGQQELKMQATEKPTQSGIDLTLPEEKTQDAGGAVAAAANVALIARLIRHGSLELDFLRWMREGCSKEQLIKGKAEQVDETFILIDEEEKEKLGEVPAWSP
ncbi:hypothetical protein CBS147332_9557 [Penicillium roqueforti]|nr:hypothetical protein CBS147332_9557 [Penicillium roqueforti]KAI3094790.1 hypothetical protein CBS147331_9576 [Penicillium roqueforti]